ncbi:hypothetical protein LWF15_09850 [Kineosporia rhizophila]|uniref:hypothetical protein n=1 Tax=Kineosporia rhizophila TaxID=84633 RepID=UPI000ADC61B5|nr:hypothetical protein [Kineosporia rhizophila]MCE0535814.1 hypothetical protein [Kineosporia rhizophila]
MTRLRGVTAAGILAIGALATSACGSDSASGAASGPVKTQETTETTTAPTTSETPGTPEATADEALPDSGKGVTIVPVDGFEGGLTLEDEGLSMTDDDSGRQLFTFKSLGGELYQVKATDGSGELEPLCWRAPDADEISPSPIVAGECGTGEENLAFSISKAGSGYVISRENGELKLNLGSDGLEYGDKLTTEWRINV